MKFDSHKKDASRKWAAKQRKAGVDVPAPARKTRPAARGDTAWRSGAEAARETGPETETDSDSSDALSEDETAQLRKLIVDSEAAQRSDAAAAFAAWAAVSVSHSVVSVSVSVSNAASVSHSLSMSTNDEHDTFNEGESALLSLDLQRLDAALATLPLATRLAIDQSLLEDDLPALTLPDNALTPPQVATYSPTQHEPSKQSEYAKLLKSKTVANQINPIHQITNPQAPPLPIQSRQETNAPASIPLSKSTHKPIPPQPLNQNNHSDNELDALLSGSHSTTAPVKKQIPVSKKPSAVPAATPSTRKAPVSLAVKNAAAAAASKSKSSEADDLQFLDDLLDM
ncbi:hypothetical protein HDU98_002494 [Podochytrium sp. JEL0797]|nr:hypothetical protein HDU98_002494 [Podochytrium sp. JEL0797]